MSHDDREIVSLGVLVILLLVAVITAGCDGIRLVRPEHRVLGAAAPPAVCSKLSQQNVTLTIASIVVGGWASAASAASGAVDSPTWARWTLIGSSAALYIAGAITGYFGARAAAKFTRVCQ